MDVATLSNMGRLEMELVGRIADQTSGTYSIKAFAVWLGDDGRVEMGPVRWGRRHRGNAFLSVSPFPGAWVDVAETSLLALRHVEAVVSRKDAEAIAALPRWGDAGYGD